ncbi:hypothetical protein [Streptomyces sp. NPDC006997]|uniref:hypothetical protein n=1 Tax=Streptomyces sp. NPDC006997 TaxID=3155356 RepID=UPI0033C05058
MYDRNPRPSGCLPRHSPRRAPYRLRAGHRPAAHLVCPASRAAGRTHHTHVTRWHR